MELMQGSATVIATRTAAMANAGTHPSAAHDREMKRMVDEKVDASAASLAGMAFSATAACQSLWLGSLWGGRAPTAAQLQRATTRVLGAGLAPYQKTVRDNVRRLRK
ncbi:hypothetical protein [Rhodanobacter ginsengiterrae]|uniref:hypothetical protein n=1 Tax=Rhodanobacter ginsengiterrae TaxID=2008451 RepID=UPI003CEB14AC